MRGVMCARPEGSSHPAAASRTQTVFRTIPSRLPLPPGGEHPRIVLSGGEDFVARLQVEAELADLQPLGRVPREGDLLRIAAERPARRRLTTSTRGPSISST